MLKGGAVGLGNQVLTLEPPPEKAAARIGGTNISTLPELLHFSPKRGDQRGDQLVAGCVSQRFVGREPPMAWQEHIMRRRGEVWMQCHYFFPPRLGMLTSTIVMVSLPKMSTTFTAIFRSPAGHS